MSGGGEPNLKNMIGFLIFLVAPKLSYYLKTPLLDPTATQFFDQVIRQAIKDRKANNNKKNDFIDLFAEAIRDFEKKGTKEVFSESEIEDIIVSNCLLLFIAGQDTTSSALSATSHFLAKHQDIQEKLFQEIKDAIDENDGDPNLEYNKLHNLRFLDCVIKESLRLWGFNFFDRTCSKDYHLIDMNFTVPKGMHIQIAGAGIMREEKYYKNPLHFDPESHFEDDSSSSLYPPSFMAFGQGPRNCIGMRFAYTMVRLDTARLSCTFFKISSVFLR